MHFFNFHIGDWSKATAHLTHQETAIYLSLICYYYDQELPIPLQVDPVIRKLRLQKNKAIVVALLGEFFKKTQDGWRHERCDSELAEIYDKSEKARHAAEVRWQSKRNADAMQTHSERNADGMLDECHPIPITHNPIPTTHNPVSGKPLKAPLDYSSWPTMPEQQTLADWIAMRKRIKADVSQTVINNFSKEFWLAHQSGITVDECLSECIASNWRGFKFTWLKNREVSNAANQRPTHQTRGERNDQAFRDYIAGLDAQEDNGSVLAGLIGPATGD